MLIYNKIKKKLMEEGVSMNIGVSEGGSFEGEYYCL